MRSLIAIFSVCFLCFACQRGPQGSIAGRVTEQVLSRPLRGALVRLGPGHIIVRCDSNGMFQFPKVPPGVYDLECALPVNENDWYHRLAGYRDTVLRNVVVKPNDCEYVAISLEATWDQINLWQPVALSSVKSGWAFFLGTHEGGGDPWQSFAKLIAVSGSKRRVLLYRMSLKGYVDIKSPAQALEFVRLFSSYRTGFMFKDSGACNRFFEVVPTTKEARAGELAASQFKSLGLSTPKGATVGNDFIIERYVFAYDRKLYKIHERVSPDGGYEIIDRQFITADVPIELIYYM